jgi:tRNA modification GTPase
MASLTDTIFALSSGTVPAGIAIIRVSGPAAFPAAEALIGTLPPARQASLRAVRSRDGAILDHAVVLAFPSPHSFTGEDCVEFHLHGSRAVVAAVFREFETLEGLRHAEAGEFSRRALENGKLDLVEIEGLGDLIAAETEMQRRLAVEQSFGGQSALYENWAKRLTQARALIEAELDFADEEDVPGSVSNEVWADMTRLTGEIEDHIASAKSGEIIRDGYKVVIAGPPNAGKSSLLNALAKRDIAIVTDIAGTTRDVLYADLDIEGYLVRFFDTAGLRETVDIVEQEGVRRAQMVLEDADLVLLVEEIDSPAERVLIPADKPVLRLGSKADVHGASGRYDICISVHSQEGLDELRNYIVGKLREVWAGSSVPSRMRHIEFLKEASNSIREALNGSQLDLRAEHLRAAGAALGRITGRVDVEQLLDIIFSQFCIGK